MPQSLSDLSDSAETKIARAVAVLLRGGKYYGRDKELHQETFFSDAFRPILLLESTDRRVREFAQGKLVVVPGAAKQDGMPSDRVTLHVPIFIIAYLPPENSSEESKFNASNLGGKLRQLLWNAQALQLDGQENLTFATIDFQHTDARIPDGASTLVSTYRAIYETDVEPTSGGLI